ncbi:hypothetical protein [Microbacterium sp. JZ101]
MANRPRAISRLSAGGLLALVSFISPGAADAAGPWSVPTPIYAASSIQSPGYAYAPSGIDGSTERYYACHSRASGDIRDSVFLIKRVGDTVTSSTPVLSSSSSGWDSFHICDPSVVRVNSTLNGQSYTYAMFYLGNDQNCSCHNQVGVAFSNSLDGPWVKYPAPLIGFRADAGTAEWGAGQPSATTVSVAGGVVALTWTEGYSDGTVGWMARVDLLTGTPTVSGAHGVPSGGLRDADGRADFLNNFDIAYSPVRDRFYMVRERHPYPSSSPSYVSTAVEVLSIPGPDMWAGTGTWTVEGVIGSSISGTARTHNPGFVRTEFGTLPDEALLSVLISTSDPDPNSLWSYAIARTTAPL